MCESIPVSQLSDCDNPRYKHLVENFKAKYGTAPEFLARAPGRINIIGEHIDYCGYAVLPMAIEQDMTILAKKSEDSTIKLSNTDPKYGDFQCSVSDFVIDKDKPKWYHYFLCGFKGVVEKIGSSTGMNLLLDGTVPPSAGLSSSSALVCCAALTTSHINQKQSSKTELAEICQLCEKYIGTEGGGMDQAISYLAKPGIAKMIEFNPIRTTDVYLPDDAVFVVSNSCVKLNKAATSHFNTRVAECRLATQVMAKEKGLTWRETKRLGDLQNCLGLSLPDMLQLTKELLHPEPYSKQEICNILEVTNDELNQISLSEKTYAVDVFKLHDRAVHVYSEAQRVLQFKNVCEQKPSDTVIQLGQLMNASFQSCNVMYECSCEELNTLAQLCLDSGALGSRLTGAGWGGCVISLVPADQIETFIQKIANGYYSKTESRKQKVKEALFSTKPGGGAEVLQISM